MAYNPSDETHQLHCDRVGLAGCRCALSCPETPIDMFVTEPFPFDDEYERALVKPLHGSFDVRFVSMPALIRMKEVAGRTQDLIDIQYLKLKVSDDAGK
jgi:hypothetical protein